MRVMGICLVVMLGMPSAWAFDVQGYLKRKAAGSASLTKVGTEPVYVASNYDSQTGAKLAPTTSGVSLTELQAQRDTKAAELADIDAVIADVKALP